MCSLKVAIIAGGLTHEREVSIRSGRRTANKLRQRGHLVEIFDVDQNLVSALKNFAPDVVWPLVHGSIGEDGSIQDLLSLLNLRFVGSTSAAARVASYKPVAKEVLRSQGLSTPDAICLPQSLFRQVGVQAILENVSKRFSFPLVVKPAQGGSSLGVSVVANSDELRMAMVGAFAYGDEVLIEEFINGKEITVSIVDLSDGPTALPLVEVCADNGKYDYDARYNAGRSEFFVPARLDEEFTKVAQEAGITAHKALGLRDYSRIDLLVDRDGTPWFIDANIAPGLTDTSLFPQAAQAFGNYAELLNDIAQYCSSAPVTSRFSTLPSSGSSQE